MRKGATRPDHLQVLERRTFVFGLRKLGTSYRAIHQACLRRFGDTLPRSYHPRHVYADVLTTMQQMHSELAEDVALVRQLELARLDDLTLNVWPRARAGDDRAIVVVLRLMERRARLLGLDGPLTIARTAPKGQDLPPPEMMSEEYVNEVCRLLALHGQMLINNGTTPGQEETP